LASPPTESAYRTQSEYPSSSTNTPVNDIQSSYESKSSSQKMAVFKEAQAKANLQIDQITEQVAVLAAEDAQRRLQSTTQTGDFFYLFNFILKFVFFSFRLFQHNLLHLVKHTLKKLILLQLQQQLVVHQNLIVHHPINKHVFSLDLYSLFFNINLVFFFFS
jgi:hypothetical protein